MMRLSVVVYMTEAEEAEFRAAHRLGEGEPTRRRLGDVVHTELTGLGAAGWWHRVGVS
ncbi:hypothetical protein GCM10009602_70600 [Nocardiopsis tropica]